MQIMIILAVALGGAFGSLLRYFMASLLYSPASSGFPWAIFLVNVSGGLAMGVLTELAALKLHLTPEVRAFLTVGVLGGYTTFSTFSLDSVLLIQRGAYATAGVYIVGSTVFSIMALYAGLWIVRAAI